MDGLLFLSLSLSLFVIDPRELTDDTPWYSITNADGHKIKICFHVIFSLPPPRLILILSLSLPLSRINARARSQHMHKHLSSSHLAQGVSYNVMYLLLVLESLYL